MKLYSVDIKICATAYIKAKTPEEAFEIAKSLKHGALELSPDEYQDIPISGRQYDDPDLPDVSLSPAMTVYGPFDGETIAHLADELDDAKAGEEI